MRHLFRRLATASLTLLIALPGVALAAQGVMHTGNLTIRYNAISATALPIISARRLGVQHTPSQGLLNVVVTRGKGVAAPSIAADVTARAMAGNGSVVPIHVRTIKDDNGVSYLGTFHVPASGTLRFDLDVTPQGAATQHIQFKQDFLVN